MDIRVAIFDDNNLVRDALSAILNSSPGYICCGAFDAGKAWQYNIEQSRPDVILMDIEMPGLNGIELTGLVTKEFPEIKILMQTVFDDSEKIFLALCAGASGYILKTDSPQKYMESINEIMDGGAPMNSLVARKTLSFFKNQNVILIKPTSTDYLLSKREIEILHLLIERYQYKEIAEELFISYETVRTHIKRIYKKLHVSGRSEAIQKAIQQGFSC